MATISKRDVLVPLTVPRNMRSTYVAHYLTATQSTGRLFLFAGDQKIEHLNADFFGEGVPEECGKPEHFFNIASQGRVGVFATQLGLISRYGDEHRDVNYVVKLNSKSNLVPTAQAEPRSLLINSVEEVVAFKAQSKLNIIGVGYTIYVGSEFEADMFRQAAQAIYTAQQHGLLTVLWMYPRGKAVPEEKNANVIAGAAGIGACLGADFVKVNPPKAQNSSESAEELQQAVRAAGRTQLICSGGSAKNPDQYLTELYEQITIGGAAGCATGRNVHQKNLKDAIKMTNAITAIIYEEASVDMATRLLV